jgi:DNA-binding MarR family transcriptional regulator
MRNQGLPMNEGNNHILDLLQQAGRLTTKALAEVLRQFALTPAQFDILNLVWLNGELQQRRIIDERGVEAATVGTTLTRLERDGWVIRVPDPQDGRGRIVRATEKAIAEREAIAAAVSALEKKLAEIPGGREGLQKMIAVLKGVAEDV